MNEVEIIIDRSVENRRFRIRGFLTAFFVALFAAVAFITVASISASVLRSSSNENVKKSDGSSDKYQDIRYTFVGGDISKEYMSEDDLAAEEAKIAEIEAKKKAEEEAEKEAKTKEVEAKKSGTYVPPKGEKVVYLTFDDGPGPYTAKLLDVLKKYNVKATFFVTCNRPKYRDMILRAYNEGHSIGLHSCSHEYYKVYADEAAFFIELQSISDIVRDITGVETKLVRFPGGSSNTVSKKYNKGIMTRLAKELGERGYVYFDWNVSSGDSGNTRNTNTVYNNVLKGLRGNYSIVLQHDIHEFSVNAVEKIIADGLKYGFTFKALEMNSPTAHHKISN